MKTQNQIEKEFNKTYKSINELSTNLRSLRAYLNKYYTNEDLTPKYNTENMVQNDIQINSLLKELAKIDIDIGDE